jgi:hypothetical protein
MRILQRTLRLVVLAASWAMLGALPGCFSAMTWAMTPKIPATEVLAAGIDASDSIVVRLRFANGSKGLVRYHITGPRTHHDLETITDAGAVAVDPTGVVEIPAAIPAPSAAEPRFSRGTSVKTTVEERDLCFRGSSPDRPFERVAGPDAGVDWGEPTTYKMVVLMVPMAALDLVTLPIQFVVYLCVSANGGGR